jgi:F0F1-type ATP synthase membrane subunit c/vacuolar-type H+-ATPase subunit K
MGSTLKLLRAVQLSMLASILLYGVVGEILGPALGAVAVDPSLNYAFATASVALVGVILVVRRTLVIRSAESLASHPDDTLSLGHWRTGYMATYILCEALALFGLVLRFMGSNLRQSLPFYIGGFILLFFFAPRQPASPATT